jgi:cytochrome c oxidase subunit 2
MGFNMRTLRWPGILLICLTVIALPAAAVGQESEAAKPADQGGEVEAPVKRIKMYAEEWKWTPNLIRVPVGARVKIEFLSYGASRRFDLKAYKLKVKLPQDKVVTVEFVADKKGEFKWRCGRPCGDGCAKMTGKLIVE